MAALDTAEIMAFADADQWASWLADHHAGSTGVWLKIAKKRSGRTSVTIADALDVALCHGWIDSQRRTHDQDHHLQRYSPRRPKSAWSRINVGQAEALIAAGRMREPGLAAIRAAKADGRWDDTYPSQREAAAAHHLGATVGRRGRAAQADQGPTPPMLSGAMRST